MTRTERSAANADQRVTSVRDALLALPAEERAAVVADALEDGGVTVATDVGKTSGVRILGSLGERVAYVSRGHDAMDAVTWLAHLHPDADLEREAVIDLRSALPAGSLWVDGKTVLASIASTAGARLTESPARPLAVKASSPSADASRVETQDAQPVSRSGQGDAASSHATIPLDTPELVAYRDQILRRLGAKKQALRERNEQERSA